MDPECAPEESEADTRLPADGTSEGEEDIIGRYAHGTRAS